MKKFLLGFLITIILIVVLVAVAFVVLINLTPRQLGMQELKLGDDTIEELGLADTKFIDIYKSIRNMDKVKEEDIVSNPVNQEQEKGKADDNFEGSTLDAKDDYSSVVKEPVLYDVQRLIKYDDTTIAYILDNIIQHADAESSSEIKALKDANLSVKELTIGLKDGKGTLRVVSYMDLSNYQGEIQEALGGAAGILPIPKKAYLVSNLTFTVNAVGKMVTSPESICINGNNDDPVSKAILKVIGNMAGGESIDSLNGKLGEAVAQVVGNLGMIGTASTVGDTNVVNPLTINLGIGGVQDHKLTLVTYGL